VLFSHGSLGGIAAAPHEPGLYMPPELIEYFVRRGYTVVQPTRRGLGESTGARPNCVRLLTNCEHPGCAPTLGAARATWAAC
jgi:hypothetical protein